MGYKIVVSLKKPALTEQGYKIIQIHEDFRHSSAQRAKYMVN
jgi:hypothetical protein